MIIVTTTFGSIIAYIPSVSGTSSLLPPVLTSFGVLFPSLDCGVGGCCRDGGFDPFLLEGSS